MEQRNRMYSFIFVKQVNRVFFLLMYRWSETKLCKPEVCFFVPHSQKLY